MADVEKDGAGRVDNIDRKAGYTTAQDWEGSDDAENPLNWSALLRYYHICVASLLSFAATYPSSAFSPAIELAAEKLNVSREVSILSISLYVLGLGFGPMVASGISETYGRRVVYLGLTPIALLFHLGGGLADSIGGLLVCRFLAGLIGSAPLAVGAGTVADVSHPRYRATAIGIWVLSPFLGPALGPSTTSYAVQNLGWRWYAWCVLIVGGSCYTTTVFQRETYKKIILKRRARRYGLEPPHDPIPTSIAPKIKFLTHVTIFQATRMLLTEPIVTFLSVYIAFVFTVTFGLFSGLPYIVQHVYSFDTGATGLTFLSIGVGSLIATILFVYIDRKVYVKKLVAAQGQPIPPEERLYPCMLGAILIPLGLFWFAWTSRHTVHWIVPLIGLGVYACGSLLVFDTCILYIGSCYPAQVAASAQTGHNLLRYAAGAASPLFMVQLLRAWTIPWGLSFLGFLSIALAFVPFIFYRMGKSLRARSSFDTAKI